jgi:hypothetical protein
MTPAELVQTGVWPESCTHRELRLRVEHLTVERDRFSPESVAYVITDGRVRQAQDRLDRTFHAVDTADVESAVAP